MRSTHDAERGMAAPETLGLDTRVEIRKAAVKLLEEMPEGVGRLVIDLGAHPPRRLGRAGRPDVDSAPCSGAAPGVVLRNPSDEIRFLLVLTKLDDLFQLESAAA